MGAVDVNSFVRSGCIKNVVKGKKITFDLMSCISKELAEGNTYDVLPCLLGEKLTTERCSLIDEGKNVKVTGSFVPSKNGLRYIIIKHLEPYETSEKSTVEAAFKTKCAKQIPDEVYTEDADEWGGVESAPVASTPKPPVSTSVWQSPVPMFSALPDRDSAQSKVRPAYGDEMRKFVDGHLKARDLSRRSFARKAGVPQSSFNNWLNGNVRFSSKRQDLIYNTVIEF